MCFPCFIQGMSLTFVSIYYRHCVVCPLTRTLFLILVKILASKTVYHHPRSPVIRCSILRPSTLSVTYVIVRIKINFWLYPNCQVNFIIKSWNIYHRYFKHQYTDFHNHAEVFNEFNYCNLSCYSEVFQWSSKVDILNQMSVV